MERCRVVFARTGQTGAPTHEHVGRLRAANRKRSEEEGAPVCEHCGKRCGYPATACMGEDL